MKESKDRVKSALKNSGYDFPNRKITVNLAPADVRKEGAAFDLPISIGILAATGVVKALHIKEYLLLGELSLDGGVKPVRGCLPVAVAAKNAGFRGIIVPLENACEGAVVEGIDGGEDAPGKVVDAGGAVAERVDGREGVAGEVVDRGGAIAERVDLGDRVVG